MCELWADCVFMSDLDLCAPNSNHYILVNPNPIMINVCSGCKEIPSLNS